MSQIISKDFMAQLLALIFLLLIPLFIYLSLGAVTLVLPVLYFWALSFQTKGWIMAQTWRDVLFLHYQVNPELLQKQVPFTLDLFENKAVISIVSFTMDRIRFPFLPSVPGLSKLNELNLRTYVDVDGIKGVYFFTLDADSSPAIFIAKTFFSLPYKKSIIDLEKTKGRYLFSSLNSSTSIQFMAEVKSPKVSDHFDLWVTERYGLFTKRSGDTLHGIVQHVPWKLNDLFIHDIQDNFSTQLGEGLKATEFFNNSYCEKLEVRFKPFYKLKPLN